MSSFLVFSLGPVQDFIATARRTQDLWMGSRILARLTGAAMWRVEAEEVGADFLFPPYEMVAASAASHGNLPNKFVVRLSSGRAERVAEIGAAAEQAARAEWRRIAEKVAGDFRHEFQPDGAWREIWQRQIDDLLEVYWCAAPESADYQASFRHAQRGFEARKGLRAFAQVTEEGEKCVVCGQRSALRREGGLTRPQVREYWKGVAAQVRAQNEWRSFLKPDGKERLCGVCAVKRFGRDALGGQPGFPSTSDIATTSFQLAVVNALANEEIKAELRTQLGRTIKNHLENLQSLGARPAGRYSILPRLRALLPQLAADLRDFLLYDGDVLHSETFTVERLKEDYGIEVSQEDARTLAQSAAAVRAAAREAGLPSPSKYYAVLFMDGDRMGAKLNSLAEAAHHEISRRLMEFATQTAPQIAHEQYPAQLVYAGGDDVLAFAPIDCALALADELRRAFASALADFGLTASVGIAFAHHTQPLDGALTAGRRAEAAAKNSYDRQALAVHFLKRSGEELRVGTRWTYQDTPDAVAMLEKMRRLFSAGHISMKLAHAVLEEAPFLPPEAWRAELRRFLKRHRTSAWENEAGRKRLAELMNQLAGQLAALASGLQEHRDKWEKSWRRTHPDRAPAPADEAEAPQPGLVELGRWLTLARFLAQGGGDD